MSSSTISITVDRNAAVLFEDQRRNRSRQDEPPRSPVRHRGAVEIGMPAVLQIVGVDEIQ
jgi:hypothetical protein